MVEQQILIIKKLLVLLTLAVSLLQQQEAPKLGGVKLGAAQPTYFAEIDNSNTVIRVIVASQAFINSGKLGDPSHWVQTYMDGSLRWNYAGIGYTYNKGLDAFIPQKPNADALLDTNIRRWRQPSVATSTFISSTSTPPQ